LHWRKNWSIKSSSRPQNIARDAGGVSQSLKSKNFDSANVAKDIDAMDADVATLQEVVAKFEATQPNLSTRDRADWDLLKTKVKLIELFQGQKKKLAAEDIIKNRSLIRAHATGLVQRAQKLQETAQKLRRS
jgi:hypothetical protein